MIHEFAPTPQWGRFEIVLISASHYENPFQELTVQATFTAPNGNTQVVDGFWDGERTWRIRFSPDQIGDWYYVTACSDTTNAGLHQQVGMFLCFHSEPRTVFEKHGALRLSDDRRYLAHADGTPFLWLADTAWNGPLRATPEAWDQYLAERTRQKFTAVQWVPTQWIAAPDGDLNGALPFDGHEHITVHPAFFQRLDARLAAINAAGLLGVPVLLWAAEWGDPEVMAVNPGLTLPESQCILLARYMVARWGSHHVVWILAGDGDYRGEKALRWQRIGRAVFGNLSNTLVTLHPTGMQWIFNEFIQEAWMNIIGYQSCHFGNEEAMHWLLDGPPATDWKRQPARPFINMEPPYENHLDLSGTLPFDAHAIRRALYWSLLVSPTAGVTYGGHGVWGWDDGTTPPAAHPKTGIPLPWQKALIMPAAEQIPHLAKLLEGLSWWTLRPAPELVIEQPQSVYRRIAAARSESGDLVLIYMPEGGRLGLDHAIVNALSSIYWFNPRTGEQVPCAIESHQFDTPDTEDWVFVGRQ